MATPRTAATARVTAHVHSFAAPLRHLAAAVAVEGAALLVHLSMTAHAAVAVAEVCVLWLWWRRRR
ncbi:MAG: hypothetical protein ACLP36_16905 [Acidimicrobiales bacterium]